MVVDLLDLAHRTHQLRGNQSTGSHRTVVTVYSRTPLDIHPFSWHATNYKPIKKHLRIVFS